MSGQVTLGKIFTSIWRLPDMLAAKGLFLDKSDRWISVLAYVRSVLGILTIAAITYAYPGYAKSLDDVSLADGYPTLHTALKIADSIYTSIFATLVIATALIIVFAVLIMPWARPRARLAMLRALARPPVAILQFAGLVGGPVVLIDWLGSGLDRVDSGTAHAPGIVSGGIGFLAALLVFVIGLAGLVIIFKAVYLAAVDVFRADDAHPLLAPFVTTFAAWTLAVYGWYWARPTGVPHDLAWGMTFVGPLLITGIAGLSCIGLWRVHGELLFREGPGGGAGRAAGGQTAAGPVSRRAFLGGAAQIGFSLIGAATIAKLVQAAYFGPPTPVGYAQMDASVNAVAFSPDGHTVAGGTGGNGGGGTVQLWDVADPANPAALGAALSGLTSVFCVAFSPVGHTLAAGTGPGTVQLWNVADPAHPTAWGPALTAPTGFVNAVAFSPDGRTLAAGTGQSGYTGHGAIQLWDAADPAHPKVLGKALIVPAYGVVSVAFSRDGHTLAAASGPGAVQLWNITDPARPAALGKALTGAGDAVNSVAFSPDGHTLAGGTGNPSSGTVVLWDVTDPARPRTTGPALTGPTTFVNAVAFSPDGHTLAAASGQPTLTAGAIQLWNVTDPAHATSKGQALDDGGTSVGAVAFSPDGRLLAAGDGDLNCIDLWNVG